MPIETRIILDIVLVVWLFIGIMYSIFGPNERP